MTGIALRDLTARLSQHFAALRDSRGAPGTARPVFALEHGLADDEVQALGDGLREVIALAPPSPLHWLLWVVYSTESGYRYSGAEFWQTFERETPGWKLNGDRYWIRSCFRKFQQVYAGAVPSGSWAEHFSIICWPITHAILPTDLQQQFAKVLYELRNTFTGVLLDSPERLGEQIALHSWSASSRFQNLAQEKLFLGQIASALLLEDDAGSGDLIYPPTLQRIRTDLDRERRGREWLRGARRFARERVQLRGLSVPGGRRLSSETLRPDEAREVVHILGIEPRLVLRPMDLARGAWQVSLEIPNLSPLLALYPDIKTALTGSRCVVAGSSGRPLARGRCLFANQRVTLARWPGAGEVLLQFEHSHPQLNFLLGTDCMLRPGSVWLFRIASDGLAYEVRGMQVRPGRQYVVISTRGPLPPTAQVEPIELQCEGVHGALLTLPEAISPTWEHTIHVLGLRHSRSLEVSPAGLAAAAWDGQGHGEWLATERPCLAVRADVPLDDLSVSTGRHGALPLEIGSVEAGEPLFFDMDPLPPGHHRLRFSARPAVGRDDEVIGDLDVQIRIREVPSGLHGTAASGLLDVQLEPSSPSLEQLWEGNSELSIHGPVGRTVACRVALFNGDEGRSSFAKDLPPLKPPIANSDWRELFEKHFCEAKGAEEAYDAARSCSIEFRADEFGTYSIESEREFVPLRWSLRGRPGKAPIVRLFDDSGMDDHATVTYFSFEKPTDQNELDLSSDYVPPSSGGMYVARIPHLTSAILVAPEIQGLGSLRCHPSIAMMPRSVDSIVQLLELARLWGEAKLTGHLAASLRRREVLSGLASHVFRLICSERWHQAEQVALEDRSGFADLTVAISRRQDEIGAGVALERDCLELACMSCQDRVEHFASVAARFHLLPPSNPHASWDNRWLCEFILRAASDPAGVREWAGEQFRAALTTLLDSATLARAARFLVLSVAQHFELRSRARHVYGGWTWT